VAETKRKIRLQFLAHLRLSLFLGSAKRLSHGLIQKVKSPTEGSLSKLQTSTVISTNPPSFQQRLSDLWQLSWRIWQKIIRTI